MRVLVIDDEKYVADTLVMILRQTGYEAEAAYDGESALQRIELFPPDCVISDVIMTGMNGPDVCALIQSKHPNCHILLFSGQAASSEIVNEARAKGHTWELLAKPIDPDELLEILTEVAAAGRLKQVS